MKPELNSIKTKHLLKLTAGIMVFVFSGLIQAQEMSACGSLENGYGPLDYRTATKQQLNLVERAHFTAGIETLTRTGTSDFADDIGYTLRVFPNHHRALITIQKLANREKTDKPYHAQWSVACYFERAIRFQPNDPIVRMLFARYLIEKNQSDQATQQLEQTIQLAGDNGFTHFNIGLIFFDMKNYERAVTQQLKAEELGFMRPELKNRLIAVGKWSDPAPSIEVNKTFQPIK